MTKRIFENDDFIQMAGGSPLTSTSQNSAATLENINGKVSRLICQYLDILDVVNLARTCKKLLYLAESDIFPKIAQQIQITLVAEDDVAFNNRSDNESESELASTLTMKCLETPFIYIGKFVKQLALSGKIWDWTVSKTLRADCLRTFETILRQCTNLETLCIQDVSFQSEDIHLLKNVTSNLNELNLMLCSGITDEWAIAFQGLPNIKHFTLNGPNEISQDLFENFKLLNSLNINYENCPCAEDLEMIFELIGPSLQKLTLSHFSRTHYHQSIGKMICDKLPKLEHLEIFDNLSIGLNSLIEIPQLKTLTIICIGKSVSSILRKLSERGTIEHLSILDGSIDNNAIAHESPLIFNQLRSFQWMTYSPIGARLLNVLKTLTNSMLPNIESLDVSCWYLKLEESHSLQLLALFESNKTLKSLIFRGKTIENPFAIVKPIIEILRHSTPSRPFLKLNINTIQSGSEEVSHISLYYVKIINLLFLYDFR